MVSVIIRNRDEAEYIGFAIQSVVDHIKDPEIIIVDNNSKDDSLKIVSLFDRYNIKTYSIDDYTPGKALNLGVNKCSNDTILILSAHSQITKLDLDSVEEHLKNNVAVFGNQIPIFRGKKITKRYIWSHFEEGHVVNMFSKIENRQFLHNAFCFYDRQFLLDNPMPEQYAGKEDRYWAADIVSKGYNYYYDHTHKINHFYSGTSINN